MPTPYHNQQRKSCLKSFFKHPLFLPQNRGFSEKFRFFSNSSKIFINILPV